MSCNAPGFDLAQVLSACSLAVLTKLHCRNPADAPFAQVSARLLATWARSPTLRVRREVAQLGTNVTLVEPARFGKDWAHAQYRASPR